jgi:hypothetical protein
MTKHMKTRKPSDRDLQVNPFIGGSKGVRRAGVSPDELEAALGVNTIEGDVENDTNPRGGIDKSTGRSKRRPSRLG